jgi:hypothetical protein
VRLDILIGPDNKPVFRAPPKSMRCWIIENRNRLIGGWGVQPYESVVIVPVDMYLGFQWWKIFLEVSLPRQ